MLVTVLGVSGAIAFLTIPGEAKRSSDRHLECRFVIFILLFIFAVRTMLRNCFTVAHFRNSSSHRPLATHATSARRVFSSTPNEVQWSVICNERDLSV